MTQSVTSPSIRRCSSWTNLLLSGSRGRLGAQSCERAMFSCSASFSSRISSGVSGVASFGCSTKVAPAC